MSGSILIASGIEHTRDLLKKHLSLDHALIVVETAEQAIAALEQKTPVRLVFLGTSLKGNDQAIFTRIRALAGKTTIIAMGERNEEKDAVQAVQDGATGYIMPNASKAAIRSFAQKAFQTQDT